MLIRPLEGFTVGVTADARYEEQAALLRRRGAVVRHGATIECVPAAPAAVLRRATVDFIRRPPDLLIVTTGTGFGMWLAAAKRWGLFEALIEALVTVRVAARGAKAVEAVHAAELSVWWNAPSETLDELLERVVAEPLASRRVAIQCHGGSLGQSVARLTGAGADVTEIVVYQLRLPRNPTAAVRVVVAACDRRVDVVTFTTAASVRNLFELAEQRGARDSLRDAFNGEVVCACVGTICARAALDAGVVAPLVPPRARLGSMVQAISERLQARRRVVTAAGTRLAIQGSLVVIGDEHVILTARERAVLDVLARRPGCVVGRPRCCGRSGVPPRRIRTGSTRPSHGCASDWGRSAPPSR